MHPPRVSRDIGKSNEHVHAHWRRWNTLANGVGTLCSYNTNSPAGNKFHNPLIGEQASLTAYKKSGPRRSALEEEVRREGFGRVFTCPDGNRLSDIVLQKLRHPEHQKLGCPLPYDGMLSIILYTGTDAYSDLRKHQLEHQEQATDWGGPVRDDLLEDMKGKPYPRWNIFDFSLDHAIRDLGAAQLRVYGSARGLPSVYVYHGSYQCNPPDLTAHTAENMHLGAELPTVTSFSWDREMSESFAQHEGLLIKINAAETLTDAQIANLPRGGINIVKKVEDDEPIQNKPVPMSWCDVSWISKFPNECEALFGRKSMLGDLVRRVTLSTKPSLTMYEFASTVTFQESDPGCIHEDCLVEMHGHSRKCVRDVLPGDQIKSIDGEPATVLCTVRTCVQKRIEVCRVSLGCCVTSEHPVKLPESHEWAIPKDIILPCFEYVDSVYNFVLERPAHAVLIDGVACVSLGHCLDHPVLRHEIWGSSRILAYLQDQPNYPEVVLLGGYPTEQILQYPDTANPRAEHSETMVNDVPAGSKYAERGSQVPEPLVLKGIAWPYNVRCEEQLDAFLALPCCPDDVFVASYPKCGTHWVHKLVGLILQQESKMYPAEFVEWHKAPVWKGGLERTIPVAHSDLPHPRVLSTHCPLNMLPRDATRLSCRVVYVLRDVRDVAVSQYHFCNAHPGIPSETDLDAFLSRFLAGAALDSEQATSGGALLGGIAWHQRAYVEAAENGASIHILSYERLHREPVRTIANLAAFLGRTLQDNEIAVLQEKASFASMKAAARAWEAKRVRCSKTEWSEVFWRKGIPGDWVNSLTDEQGALLTSAFAESLAPIQKYLR
eukprot:TRINITY_DN6111_c0_g3_i1.p1 TRINITY_DN6111_c0_g3~~TRINITY_DN6111_c0_g3_i1.p1  ORF type:complete len:932 (+),score=104.53 TRINITY_DN6111_c0_g3_i1:303-2798(+)